MNRSLTWLLGPETVLAALSAVVFLVCARHNSGTGQDVALMEKMVSLLPLATVPLVFATVFVPGAAGWGWLVRAILLSYLMLCICAGRIINGFGTGAKGQDAAFMISIGLGTVLIALGTSVAGAFILGQLKPNFAEWFRTRRLLGCIFTLASAIPIGICLGVMLAVGLGFIGGIYSAIRR